MTRTQKSSATALIAIAPRKGRCTYGSKDAATRCDNKTRLLAIIPCSDIEDDGTAGFAAVRTCPEHFERALILVAKEIANGVEQAEEATP